MKNYESYTVEDFIQDSDFRDWVRGRSAREAFWLNFLHQYPEKKEAFRQAEQFIRVATAVPERISESEIRKEVELFLEKTEAYIPDRQKISGSHEAAPASIFRLRGWMAAAVVLTLAMGLNWYFSGRSAGLLTTRAVDSSPVPLVATTNDSRHPLRLVLSDSSEVFLNPKSQLRYPSRFTGNARTVYLKGEASFSVKRRHQPFMVYTGEMVTKVLGTRFLVRAFDLDRKITVQVLSGKVSVYKKKPDRTPADKEVTGLILHANQAAIFEKSGGNLTKTLVANPALVAKSTKPVNFAYDEVPFSLILRELEKSYGIPIQFDEQTFEGCRITAALTNESLYQKLDLLCKAASASYEITDGQIVISRKVFR